MKTIGSYFHYMTCRRLAAAWGAVLRFRAVALCVALCASFLLTACSDETLDYSHPDVDVFVKQLKNGKYSLVNEAGVAKMPQFTMDDVEELLEYAEKGAITSEALSRIVESLDEDSNPVLMFLSFSGQ